MVKDGKKLTDGRKDKSLLQGVAPKDSGKRLVSSVDKSQISFSFQFYRQIDYFGIGDQDNQWFASLLDRLKDLSGKDSSLMGDATAKGAYRLHPINWNQPRIPIKKDDLDWIPKEYRDNEAIEFLQFEISQAMGRVVGFFNETNEIFYIVLLDPKHNIQPTQRTGYKVDNTHKCLTDYEQLLEQLKVGNVSNKHIERSDRLIWMDEELVKVFLKYNIFEWTEKLEEILLVEFFEDEN